MSVSDRGSDGRRDDQGTWTWWGKDGDVTAVAEREGGAASTATSREKELATALWRGENFATAALKSFRGVDALAGTVAAVATTADPAPSDAWARAVGMMELALASNVRCEG